MARVSCMGGGCASLRDKCALHVANDRSHPVERLCEKGTTDCFEPIRVVRPAGSWARQKPGLIAPAQWCDGVMPV